MDTINADQAGQVLTSVMPAKRASTTARQASVPSDASGGGGDNGCNGSNYERMLDPFTVDDSGVLGHDCPHCPSQKPSAPSQGGGRIRQW